MISTEITVGDKKVIDSGFVSAFEGDQVEIELIPESDTNSGDEDDSTGESLTFIFEFVENEEGKTNIDVEPIDETSVKYRLINHSSGGVRMGGMTPRRGPTKEMEVGEMAERTLILNYQVSSRDGGEEFGKINDLFYTFYLGDEIDE